MPATIEKVNNPLIGTIYEAGYGFSFGWIMNHPEFDIDTKYVASVYGLYFKHDGSGSCTVHRDKLINDIAHMKTKAFIDARNRLVSAGVISVATRRKIYQENSGRRAWDTNEITLNLTPAGFIEAEHSGLRFGNILSYGFGMLPRVLFFDESLEKIDKVIASYIFANMGRIQEYLLSGVKLRKSLHTLGKNNERKELSKYQFEKAIVRLNRIFSFQKLTDDEILRWRREKHQEENTQNTHGDYYIITIKKSLKQTEKKDRNIYSSIIPKLSNLGTEEDSDGSIRSNLGTEEQGTVERGTEEQGTPINSILSKEIYTHNEYNHQNSLYHQNPEHTDDIRTAKDSPQPIVVPSECPKEIRERLGETAALKELNGLCHILGQMNEEEYHSETARLEEIIEQLYQIALTESELEETALAVNAAYLILHRTKGIGRINNLRRYIRSILLNARDDYGFTTAPVREISGYQAVLDGFKLSDNGAGRRPLYIEGAPATIEEKGIDSYIEDMKNWILCTGTEKDGCIYCSDTPLPPCLTKDKHGRRMLCRILHSFFRKSAYEVLDAQYDDLDDAILLVQKALMRLFEEKELFLSDGTLVDKAHLSKRLQTLIYLDAHNELFIKYNLYEKVTALYLKADSEEERISPEKWLITVLVNEIRCAAKEERILTREELLNPIPAFMESEISKDRKILTDAYRNELSPEKKTIGGTKEIYEGVDGRVSDPGGRRTTPETNRQNENLRKIQDYTAGIAAKLSIR